MDDFKNLPADVTRSILNLLDDVSLANTCLINKNFSKVICNSNFWLHKIMKKFSLGPSEIKEYSKGNTYWAYYLDLNKNTETLTLDDQLVTGAIQGRMDLVKIALERGGVQNINSALAWAAAKGHIDIFRLLLQKGADPRHNNDDALRAASTHGHTDILRFLLENGANIHADNDYSLRYASYGCHTETVRLLLEHGANAHFDNDDVLRYAALSGCIETIKLLLDYGLDIHAGRETALKVAVNRNDIELVKFLLDNGAVINDPGMLTNAKATGNIEMIKLLEAFR